MRNYLKREDRFYNKHKNEYREKYLGKNVLIYKNELRGVFNDKIEAYNFAIQNKFVKDKFMIRKVTSEDVIVRLTPVRL